MSKKKITASRSVITQNATDTPLFGGRKPLSAAIAAASLSMMAPQALAAINCDVLINGGNSPHPSCTVDGTLLVDGGSVDSPGVFNTGIADFINLSNGSDVGGITNTGTIGSSATAYAIYVTGNSDISGLVSNTSLGIISASQHAIYVDSSSDISGGISNSGLISASSGAAIMVSGANSNISGGITNSGTISGKSAGIEVSDYGDISGGITNNGSGLINGSYAGIRVTGISSDISGGISNAGVIAASSGAGIYIGTDVVLTGGITNSGTIEASVSVLAYGIENYGAITSVVNTGIIEGIHNAGTISGASYAGISTSGAGSDISVGIVNSGTIESVTGSGPGIFVGSSGDISGGIQNSGTIRANNSSAAGIYVDSTAYISGGIVNTGEIIGAVSGWGIDNQGAISAAATAIALSDYGSIASINNGGTVSASTYGIALYDYAEISGGITNSGSITAVTGNGIYVGSSAAILGGIHNTGTISGSEYGIRNEDGGFIEGITITDGGDIDGISNDGRIANSGTAISVYNYGDISGLLLNGGTIESSGSYGNAIYVASSGDISGGINNTGTIRGGTVTGSGIVLESYGSISGGIFNEGTITSGNSSGWGIDNHGDISGSATAIQVTGDGVIDGINNDGTIEALGATGKGISVVSGGEITQGITNDGLIQGGASGTGIYVSYGSLVSGGISNTGTIAGASKAINNAGYIEGITVSGNGDIEDELYNAGTIEASIRAIAVTGYGDISGGINNAGFIQISDSSGTGIYVGSYGSISGGIANSGTIYAGDDSGYGILNEGSIAGISVTGYGDIEGINNLGQLAGNTYGISVNDYGDISQGITNSGTIEATGVSGTGIFVGSQAGISGGISNTGIIAGGSADGYSIYNYGTIAGITVSGNGDIEDELYNAGTIEEASIRAIAVTGYGDISGGINNAGNIQITDSIGTGIYVGAYGSISGGIANSGTIYSGGVEGYGVLNEGSIAGISVTGYGDIEGINNDNLIAGSTYGVSLSDYGDISGGITNSGTIGVTSTSGVGISVGYGAMISGGITNTGTIEGGSESGNGIYNAGTIHGITVTTSYGEIVGGIFNSGNINGGTTTGDGIHVGYGASITGGVYNIGIIEGGDIDGYAVFNEGTIEGVIEVSSSGDISGQLMNAEGGLINGGIAVSSAGDISGGVYNSGTISGETGILVEDYGSISGGVHNTGLIEGTDGIAIDASDSFNAVDITLSDNARIVGDVYLNGGDIDVVANYLTEGSFYGADNFVVNTGIDLTYGAAHNIGATTITNQGNIIIAMATDAYMSGNYVQGANGLLDMEVTGNGDGEYSQLVVFGDVDLTANDAINVNIVPDDLTSSLTTNMVLLDVITADTLTTDDFLTVYDNSALWRFEALINASSLDLQLYLQSPLQALENGGLGNTIPEYAIEALTNLDAIFDQLPLDVQYAFGNIATEAQLLDALLATLPVIAGQSLQALNMNLYDVSSIINSRLGVGAASGDEQSAGGNVWVKPYVGSLDLDEHNNVPGYEATNAGIVMGMDTQLSKQWLVGGALAYSSSSIEGAGVLDGQELEMGTYMLSVYGQARLQDTAYMSLTATLGGSQNDVTREVTGGVAEGEYDSTFGQVSAVFGTYNALSDSVHVIPEFNVGYTYAHDDAYDETGFLPLMVEESSANGLQAGMDVKLQYSLNKTSRFNTTLGFGYDSLDDDMSTTASYGVGNPFTVDGTDIDNTFVRGGVGYELLATDQFGISIDYDVEMRGDLDHQQLSARFNWGF